MKNKISYVGVKALIVNDEGKILIAQEPTNFIGGGTWELPGGKLSDGEEKVPLEEVLAREIKEELGNIDISVGKVIDVMRRPWNKPGALADMVFLAVFLCKYNGGEITLSEENNSFAWIEEKDISSYEYIDGYKEVLINYFKNI